MSQDFFMGQLRLVLVALCAYGAGAHWFSAETNTFIGAISVPLIAMFGPWIWSIYRNVNSKLVPKDSIAISSDHNVGPGAAVPPPGYNVVVGGDKTPDGNVVVKVVG